ncbi:MAG: GNAT family N-acetyltransferase [Actinomycetota bacterium]|nr:GNAT family N-acetyltransferase [Actinomycetota bacterium]
MTSGIEAAQVGPGEWRTWRVTRLRALRQDPDAFGATADVEAGYDEALWRSRLDRTGGPSVLARAGGEVVGMGAGWASAPARLVVVSMWTDPSWRGRGVGGSVLQLVVGWAVERGLLVELWVADGNLPARRVYERYGFRADGRTEPLRPGSARMKSCLALASVAP